MSISIDLFALAVAYVIGVIIHRYFILTSGKEKTNVPFIKEYNIITGSKNIIFCHDKVLMLKAHDWHKELGDTFGCYFGKNMQIFCKDPDLVYRICSTEFQKHRNRYYVDSLSPYIKASLFEARGHAWRTSRKAVGSVLNPSKLKQDNVDTDIDLAIKDMLVSIGQRLNEKKRRGEDTILDVYQINKNLIMHSILKIIYDSEHLVDFDSDYNDVVEEMHKFIYVNYEMIARICFLVPVLTNFVRPLVGLFDHGKYLSLLTDKLEKILAKTLDTSRTIPIVDSRRLTTIHSLINSYRRGELEHDQLMGNAVFLMIAGYATSVDSMSAMMFELARNQQVQDKLRSELLQYGEKSQYLDQCINETLRLYPGAMTNRDLSDHVHHNDIRFVKGSCFNVSIYSIHRDPKYWSPDAEKWLPDRFDPSLTKNHHRAQFIPFGIGPRSCVGYNLARLELSKWAAQFFLRYKVETCAQTQAELHIVPLGALPFALPIEGPVPLRLIPIISL